MGRRLECAAMRGCPRAVISPFLPRSVPRLISRVYTKLREEHKLGDTTIVLMGLGAYAAQAPVSGCLCPALCSAACGGPSGQVRVCLTRLRALGSPAGIPVLVGAVLICLIDAVGLLVHKCWCSP